MEYIGLDFHKHYTFATRITATGTKEQRRLANTPSDFSTFLQSDEETAVVFEAGRGWPALYELLRDHVNTVTMAHPLRVKAIASAKIKTDKIDATILAELLKADLIPEAHLRRATNRSALQSLRQRCFFVKIRTMVRNRIHALLDEQPYHIRQSRPAVSTLWGKQGRAWLGSLALPNPLHQQLLEAMITLMDQLSEHLTTSDALIRQLYSQDADAQLLRTLPGFSVFGAVLVSQEIDGIARFPAAKKLVAYAGLVPATYSSGNRHYHGPLTKQGSKWLRWICIQAVSPAVRSNDQIAGYYNRLKRRKGTKVARIATARRLLTIAYHLLQERRGFEVQSPTTDRKHQARENQTALVSNLVE